MVLPSLSKSRFYIVNAREFTYKLLLGFKNRFVLTSDKSYLESFNGDRIEKKLFRHYMEFNDLF